MSNKLQDSKRQILSGLEFWYWNLFVICNLIFGIYLSFVICFLEFICHLLFAFWNLFVICYLFFGICLSFVICYLLFGIFTNQSISQNTLSHHTLNLNNMVPQHPHSLNLCLYQIAGLNWTDAFRRPCTNNITRFQRNKTGHVGDHVRDIKNHIFCV